MRMTEAVDLMDAKYKGKPGWGDVYKKTRKDWLDELKVWSRTWKEKQLAWSERIRVEKTKKS